jgi:L-fuconolactonase
MRIDAHQHFWNYTPDEYGWIDRTMSLLRRDFGPQDVADLMDRNSIDGSVAVQARQSLEETEWLLDLADEHPRIQGVVGWVDLRAPDVAEQLDRFRGRPKLCGVRHILQAERDDRFMLGADFLRGIAALGDFVYDILILPRHLPVAAELVARFPKQRFVLDHLAKPNIREGEIKQWEQDLRRLAQSPNLFCKASGLVTEADWSCWKPADLRPYLDVALDAFGPRRLLFGSDWPVCLVAAGYHEVVNVVADLLSSAHRRWVFGENAVRVYGLQEVAV